MTNEKKAALKRRAVDGSKLIAAIGALTTAVLGYNNLLEKLELVVHINSLKLNALTAKVAYIEGRIDGMGRGEAEAAVEVKMSPMPPHPTSAPKPAPDPVSAPKPPEADEDEPIGVPAPDAPDMVGPTEVMADVPEQKIEDKPIHEEIKDLAYQRLPVNLAGLERFQEQLQVQEDVQ